MSVEHRAMANALRFLAIDAVEKAKSGHPGLPMGLADVTTVLFRQFLKFDSRHPSWPDRDRFVLSGGHGSMLLYSLLHLTGYEKMPLDALKAFRQLGSAAPGHPEADHECGIETTTGPLGQGVANAVGMALAERLLNARFGDSLVDRSAHCIVVHGVSARGRLDETAGNSGTAAETEIVGSFGQFVVIVGHLVIQSGGIRRLQSWWRRGLGVGRSGG